MVTAQYPGKCPCCGEKIEPGDEIGRVDGEWCCAQCVADYEEDEH